MSIGERGTFGARARACVAITALASLVGLGWTRSAAAQSHFQTPEGCGSHAEFSQELERLLGAEAARAEPQSVSIEQSEAGTEYRLRIVLRDGTRELWHADCRTLFRSAVVVAAASYQEERRRRQPPPAPPVANPPAPVREEPSVPIVFRLSGGVGAASGPLPGIAPLFEISGGAVYSRLGLSLALRALSGTEERTPTGQGVFVTGLGARLLATFEPWRPLRAAVGAGAYRLRGEGRGTSGPLTDVTYNVEPAVELAVIPLRTESLALELAVGAHWAAVQPRFLITGFGEVYVVPEFGGEGLFRVTWLIP
jgi:hypothetical protein